jgi:hypothetical protein
LHSSDNRTFTNAFITHAPSLPRTRTVETTYVSD